MTINKKKIKHHLFCKNRSYNKISKKYKNLNIENYPILNKYKYLGKILDNNMNLKADSQMIINKML